MKNTYDPLIVNMSMLKKIKLKILSINKMKKFLKKFLSPIVINFLVMFKNRKYDWRGNYGSWQDAQKNSTGYDSDEILRKVRNSMLKVKNGKAAYERDSVIFDEIQYSWPLLAGLMFAAAKSEGKIRVLDFGGSLGSTYFQNKKFLDNFEEVSWCIVEQKKFVDVGIAEFQDERLKFFYDVQSCIEIEKPNILILSSVLQYLEKPYETLDELLSHRFEFVIVDRTPFSIINKETITLQIVPPYIYTASYPCWFFEELKFLNYFKKRKFKIIERFDALEGKTNKYYFKGFIFRRLND